MPANPPLPARGPHAARGGPWRIEADRHLPAISFWPCGVYSPSRQTRPLRRNVPDLDQSFDRASTPTTSHPILQAPATFTVTGIGPLSVSPETIGAAAYSIRAGDGDHVLVVVFAGAGQRMRSAQSWHLTSRDERIDSRGGGCTRPKQTSARFPETCCRRKPVATVVPDNSVPGPRGSSRLATAFNGCSSMSGRGTMNRGLPVISTTSPASSA